MPHAIHQRGILHGSALAVFLAIVHLANDAITSILGALLPGLQARYHAGPAELSLLVAVYWIAASISQPAFGVLAEKHGLRQVGAFGVVLASVALSLVGIAPDLGTVLLLLVVGGFGSAALHPVGFAAAGAAGASRTLSVGLFTAGGMIGFAIGPLLILMLVSRYGMAATPWLMVPGILLGVLFYRLLPSWKPHSNIRWRRVMPLDLLRGPIGALVVAAGLVMLAFITVHSSLPIWLVDSRGERADSSLIGISLGMFSLGAGIGSILGGFWANRVNRTALVAGSLLLSVVALVVMLQLTPGSVPFLLAAALGGALLYMSNPVMIIAAQDLAPHSPAGAAGLVSGLSSALAGVLYFGLGWLQETLGLSTGMAIGFVMVVPAALIVGLVLMRRPVVRDAPWQAQEC